MTAKSYFLTGVAFGAGTTMVAGAINNTATAIVIVLSILVGGYALGRAHTAVEVPLSLQDDEETPVMIPDRSIPMEHEHGED